jgi:hypothetical protein
MDQKIINFDRESSILSIKLSAILSIIYASISILILFQTRDELYMFPSALILGSPLIALIVIYPSIIFGYLTGRIISNIAKFSFAEKTPTAIFAIISMFICSSIVLAIHMVFGIKIDLSFDLLTNPKLFEIKKTYLLTIGIPFTIYILAGGWFGWKTHSKVINS